MKVMYRCIGVTSLLILVHLAKAQAPRDSLASSASLKQCIQYAIAHQPLVQQALIDQKIVESTIKSKLADWYPQVSFAYNLQNNFQLPSANFAGSVVHTGSYNTSTAGIQATQNIFNRDVLLASHTAQDVRTQAKQLTEADKIAITVSVTQAFYAVLLNEKQIALTEEDILRLRQSLKNAYAQYQATTPLPKKTASKTLCRRNYLP
jgi:outer membrane protein